MFSRFMLRATFSFMRRPRASHRAQPLVEDREDQRSAAEMNLNGQVNSQGHSEFDIGVDSLMCFFLARILIEKACSKLCF